MAFTMSMKCAPLRAPRPCVARGRRSLVCKAEADSAPSTSKTPEWIPEQAGPLLKFLESTDVKLDDVEAYKTYVKPYVESEFFKLSTGWKELPETINGRAAMIGFVAAAGAEILGSGSILSQLSRAPQSVLLVLALVVASSAIPIYKGIQGDYLSSLRDTYSVPEGVFTEANEKVHGRLAMLGLTALLLLEMVTGRALL
ncbi:hypothetical protein PLESTB_000687900 [Pleodorina starrii]|uniref:Uncharacterized protein n=1 Tax=Pleodorina starrii TaxID=330485 RepID=A0A9W6F1I3_9CHLO|nr:hypothetical protein PLESTM_001229300 [Pleodorina starrii]GLC52917.1 hypothetical protein PLESTB_000687900 [Pleodorina starrii]GLC65212.1 hypothetical protein PLESTF_000264100 [Pleodorina starrii]